MATAKRKKALANLPDSLEIRKYPHRYADDPRLPRVKMIVALSSNPKATISELATASGRCKRTIQKYLTILAEDGVKTLLAPLGRPNKLTEENVEKVRAAIRTHGFTSPDQVQAWIFENLGITFRRSGIRRFLKDQLAVRSVLAVGPKQQSSVSAEIRLPSSRDLLDFMNSLTLEVRKTSALIALRDGLLRMLPGVRRILASCVDSALPDPGRPANPGHRVLTSDSIDAARDGTMWADGRTKIRSNARNETTNASTMRMLESRDDINLDDFLPPEIIQYYVSETRLIGTLILLYPPSSERWQKPNRAILEAMRPFLTFVISDAALRAHAEITKSHDRMKRVDDLAILFGLTSRQKEVALYYIDGISYKEIASELGISISTVKQHIREINSKCNTSSSGTLNARLDNLPKANE